MSDQQPNPSAPTSPQTTDKRGIITLVVIFGGLFLMLLIFSVVVIGALGDGGDFGGAGNQIGVVEITGEITSSKKTVADLHKFAHDANIKGIVVRINSPGGAVAPSQEMFQAVKRAGDQKPLVVSMGSTAASGAYYTSIGAKHIIANPGTVTGSIGVISQVFDVKGLLDDLDVKVNTIKTGKFKDTGSPFRDFNTDDRKYFDQLIADIYDQFVEDVAKARGLKVDKVRKLADGRVYTGRQAKKLGLIDQLGTFRDSVDWVKKKAKITGEPTLVYPEKDKAGLLSSLIKGATQSALHEVRSQQSPLFEYRMAP